jgi:hypothetical protein
MVIKGNIKGLPNNTIFWEFVAKINHLATLI